MADIEKVVKGLECCYASFPKLKGCPVCPYEKDCYHDKACDDLLCDAIELLKSQPQIVRCKDCKHYIEKTDDEPSSCLIKAGYFPVSDDWYCADGEAKE